MKLKTSRAARTGTVLMCLLTAVILPAADPAGLVAENESFFVEKLYPVMRNVQCNLCHNDNGVASATRLEFPPAEASAAQVTIFGLSLVDLVDRREPEKSPLLLKPSGRAPHTGGERLPPGSDGEKMLRAWVRYLANFSEEELRLVRERIALAGHRPDELLAMRRLTHSQYNHTVRDLLGDQSRLAGNFPQEDFIHGFKNQSESQGVPPLQAEAYSAAAERLAQTAFRGGDRQGLVPCKPASASDAACRETFVREFGLKTFRRPLAAAEVRHYEELFAREAHRTGDFFGGARIVVEGMLQSPHFLFRVERGSGSGTEQYERASRLSYFLWDTMPDAELFDAARNGWLSSVPQIEKAARRMLRDPRAKLSMNEFLAQWMRFDRALTSIRDRRRFPGFDGELTAAMTEETRQLFDHLVWQGKNFMEFFTADYTFVSSDLARLYDFPVPPEEFAKVSYPAGSNRAGVLGHASFLTATSKPEDTSPTERGLFVREHFLCHTVPPPPPGVNANLPPVTKDKPMTNRQRLKIHVTSEACSGCHRLVDPIGFGFEQYDSIGQFREQLILRFRPPREPGERRPKLIETPVDLDTSAYIQGIADSEFSTPKELGRILAQDESCRRCVVKQLFRYAFGREETPADQPAVDRMLEAFRESGFQFQELIISLVTSRPFLGGGSS